ncbi:MAG: molybdopterin converting factor subunit 1 [Phycisphaerales bacterium]|nr:MAG: molybdopterin converting factor subunit 1 [Phycisphaerales bacterium]
MTVTVLYFGPSAGWIGAESESIDLPAGATLAALIDALRRRHSAADLVRAGVRFAVNERFAPPDAVLNDGDEVAVIPPVSGGQDDPAPRREPIWVELAHSAIPVHEVRAWVGGDARFGGIVTFDGVTRAESDAEHGRLLHLEYSAYEGMALRQMRELARRAAVDFQAGRVAIVHRLGEVVLADVSVSIAVAAAHRADAFEACRWLIDALKSDVPIWKRDVFEDGFQRWVEPAAVPDDVNQPAAVPNDVNRT